VDYSDAPAELRHTSDGVLVSQLAGRVARRYDDMFSPDSSAFVVELESPDSPTEVRRASDGVVIFAFPANKPKSGYYYDVSFSPKGTTFVVRYDKQYDENAPGEFELRDTLSGTLLATLGGDIATDRTADDLNFDLDRSNNARNGVSFSPDGSTLVVRYASGRGELWNTRGTPHRLADLGLGLAKARFIFSSGVERLAIQYVNGQLYLLDVAWLRKMGGDPRRLPAEELVRLACEGPLTSDLWTAEEQAALESELRSKKPQACRFPAAPAIPTN
jgi:hypothetical protein